MDIRLSHSTLERFLTCERMFQLDKLLVGAPDKQEWPATVFGKAIGAGIASYLVDQEVDKALFTVWKEYYPILEDEKRSQAIALNLMMCMVPKLDNLLQDWEVATFPDASGGLIQATELSFRINGLGKSPDNNIYFVGYVDVVLRNKWNGRYAIMENKTTGLGLLDIDPLYKNSGQALGYSIVLDKIAGKENAEYDVLYFVGQLNSLGGNMKPTVHIKEYPKTLNDRLNWFISLGLDVARLEQMLELNVFPRRGGICVQYMKPCIHFGTCNLQSLDRYKVIPEDVIQYQFTYDLDNLITDHLMRELV